MRSKSHSPARWADSTAFSTMSQKASWLSTACHSCMERLSRSVTDCTVRIGYRAIFTSAFRAKSPTLCHQVETPSPFSL